MEQDRIFINLSNGEGNSETFSFEARHLELGRLDILRKCLTWLIQIYFNLSKDEAPTVDIKVPDNYRIILKKDDEL